MAIRRWQPMGLVLLVLIISLTLPDFTVSDYGAGLGGAVAAKAKPQPRARGVKARQTLATIGVDVKSAVVEKPEAGKPEIHCDGPSDTAAKQKIFDGCAKLYLSLSLAGTSEQEDSAALDECCRAIRVPLRQPIPSGLARIHFGSKRRNIASSQPRSNDCICEFVSDFNEACELDSTMKEICRT
ncbi:hypothetical protein ACP70R_023030 [Stipagrostis hirtigluma subsp. patula]